MSYTSEEEARIDAFFASELVRLCEGADAQQKRALTHLILASLASDRSGSTRLPLDEELGMVERHLQELSISADEIAATRAWLEQVRVAIPSALAGVLGREGERKPLLLVEDCLYHERAFVMESAFVEALRERFTSDAENTAHVESATQALASLSEANLSIEQRAGVMRALTSRFTLITGGPGTGKTALTVSILRALAHMNTPLDEVALAAPTGRAAQRMVDAMARSLRALKTPADSDTRLLASLPTPATLHRLLEYSPRNEKFQRHERNPIPARFVIVDEGSMIDLVLATRLVRSLRSDAHLIVLGDAEQLPSVETGAVFRDLVRAAEGQRGLPHLTRLTKSYRMDLADQSGKHIFDFAARVLAGDTKRALEHAVERGKASELHFQGVERVGAKLAAESVDRFFEDYLRPNREAGAQTLLLDVDGSLYENDVPRVRALLDHFEHARILTATRTEGNELSAARVNKRLHARVANDESDFEVGEPIMMQRNDYDRGLFNGDAGIVLKVLAHGASEPHLAAVFTTSDGLAVAPLESLRRDVELAYATTVHKAQGSEFDRVMVLLPSAALPMLTRDLLYTAVTRARSSVVLVADPESLARTVERRTERFSGVAERLLGKAFSPL